MRFRLGLRPRLHWKSLQRSPEPLDGFRGPTYREWEGEEGENGRRREKRAIFSPNISLKSAPLVDRREPLQSAGPSITIVSISAKSLLILLFSGIELNKSIK